MRVVYQNPTFNYSTAAIAEFIKQEGVWSGAIFHHYPELEKYRGKFNQSSNNAEIIQEISSTVEAIYQQHEVALQQKLVAYQADWDLHQQLINERLSAIFGFDTREIFNDLICNISLNPSSPRYLASRVFDVFYLHSDRGATGSALHEIVHNLWFYLWQQKYADAPDLYESPSLIWILSEAVVEPILNDPALNEINPYHQLGTAYACFYKMEIEGKPLYDVLYDLYRNHSLELFMEKSYAFMLEHEEEIRKQM